MVRLPWLITLSAEAIMPSASAGWPASTRSATSASAVVISRPAGRQPGRQAVAGRRSDKRRRGAASQKLRDLGALAPPHQAEPNQPRPENREGNWFGRCHCAGLQPLLSPREEAQLVSASIQ